MAKIAKSAKQIQIDKANATIVLIVSIASMITAFSLVAVKSLLSQRTYQSHVISQQTAALKVAKADVKAVESLKTTYETFNTSDANIIGGSATGTTDKDGANSKIVLDALPSQYDFPALVSSLEKLVTDRGLKLTALSGVDDATQADMASSTSPTAIPMPFQLGVSGSYTQVQGLIDAVEHTIRPISIGTMQIAGTDSAATLTISAKTYYQPAKNLHVTTKVITK